MEGEKIDNADDLLYYLKLKNIEETEENAKNLIKEGREFKGDVKNTNFYKIMEVWEKDSKRYALYSNLNINVFDPQRDPRYNEVDKGRVIYMPPYCRSVWILWEITDKQKEKFNEFRNIPELLTLREFNKLIKGKENLPTIKPVTNKREKQVRKSKLEKDYEKGIFKSKNGIVGKGDYALYDGLKVGIKNIPITEFINLHDLKEEDNGDNLGTWSPLNSFPKLYRKIIHKAFATISVSHHWESISAIDEKRKHLYIYAGNFTIKLSRKVINKEEEKRENIKTIYYADGKKKDGYYEIYSFLDSLPDGTHKIRKITKKEIEISYKKRGRYFIEGVPLGYNKLSPILKKALEMPDKREYKKWIKKIKKVSMSGLNLLKTGSCNIQYKSAIIPFNVREKDDCIYLEHNGEEFKVKNSRFRLLSENYNWNNEWQLYKMLKSAVSKEDINSLVALCKKKSNEKIKQFRKASRKAKGEFKIFLARNKKKIKGKTFKGMKGYLINGSPNKDKKFNRYFVEIDKKQSNVTDEIISGHSLKVHYYNPMADNHGEYICITDYEGKEYPYYDRIVSRMKALLDDINSAKKINTLQKYISEV